MATSIHCTIHGRVQGVGFRSWTVKNARKLGLTGWVRNATDNTVEALFCGDTSAVEAMIEGCADGPLAAKVSKVERKLCDTPPPTTFMQLPTAKSGEPVVIDDRDDDQEEAI